jgi:multiple sugar transport system permease protein
MASSDRKVAVAQRTGTDRRLFSGISVRGRESLGAYAILAPILGFFVLIHFYPILFAFFVSFNKYDLFTGAFAFVGLDNYFEVFTDPVTVRAMLNTAAYVIGVVTGGTSIGLFFALVLDRIGKGSVVYRTIFFMPMVVSLVAISQLWTWIYDRDSGILNWVLGGLGFGKIGWLTDPTYALSSIIIMTIWRAMGYSMVIFLAGLKAIPEEFYEAAQCDGATAVQVARHITIPLLVPILLLALVVNTINSFKVFTQVYVMSSGVIYKGGPQNSTNTFVLQIYQLSFVDFRIGVGQALAFVLTAIVLAITFVQRRFFSRFDYRY